MAKIKREREKKRQMGQFMTPISLSRNIVDKLPLKNDSIILEPSFGQGSFLFNIIDKLLYLGVKIDDIFANNLFGVELDDELYKNTLIELEKKYGEIKKHNLYNKDFFQCEFVNKFDFIIGNPPFGGTFDSKIEDKLDKLYGSWKGYNLKKETYSFFIAKSLDLLRYSGSLCFVSSDSFLTISTMAGLRHRLLDQTSPIVEKISYFSQETSCDMLLLTAQRNNGSDFVIVNNEKIYKNIMELTGNFSWSGINGFAKYFNGQKLGDYIICTSGMTIGKNEYFIRKLNKDNTFVEPYNFTYFDDKITIKKELEKARLGKMSLAKQKQIKLQEENGTTRRNIKIKLKNNPKTLSFPHKDYKYYNKANGDIIYSSPQNIIYWKNNGDAVLTYKKNGNWYLHGVGGAKFFGNEGLTWQLISSKIKMKYLPSGYILDSGAPCAFLRSNIEKDELFFILGWCLTKTANDILKIVINHTRNIQSKDIEKLPYPWWINNKKNIIIKIKKILNNAMNGIKYNYDSPEIIELNNLYEYPNNYPINYS